MRLGSLLRAVGLGGATPAAPPPGTDVAAARAALVRAGLPAAASDRLGVLLDGADDTLRAVALRTLAVAAEDAGPRDLTRDPRSDAPDPVAAVGGMVRLWPSLDAGARRAVREPRRLARHAAQQDGTTCGSAALALLLATADPRLAAWLAVGRLPEGPRPDELAAAPAHALEALQGAPPAARFRALHRVLKRRTNHRALLALRWPHTAGTPPWGAARVARFPGVRWSHHPLDGGDAGHLLAELDRVGGWAAAGVPVPLYSGGDSVRSTAAAVPRHVVLVVGSAEGRLEVFEPSRGAVLRVPTEDLVAGRPHAALGGWSHLAWAVVPEPGVTWRDGRPHARMDAPSPSER